MLFGFRRSLSRRAPSGGNCFRFRAEPAFAGRFVDPGSRIVRRPRGMIDAAVDRNVAFDWTAIRGLLARHLPAPGAIIPRHLKTARPDTPARQAGIKFFGVIPQGVPPEGERMPGADEIGVYVAARNEACRNPPAVGIVTVSRTCHLAQARQGRQPGLGFLSASPLLACSIRAALAEFRGIYTFEAQFLTVEYNRITVDHPDWRGFGGCTANQDGCRNSGVK